MLREQMVGVRLFWGGRSAVLYCLVVSRVAALRWMGVHVYVPPRDVCIFLRYYCCGFDHLLLLLCSRVPTGGTRTRCRVLVWVAACRESESCCFLHSFELFLRVTSLRREWVGSLKMGGGG